MPGAYRTASGELPEFGDYEIIEEIARGGMGVVYRARQKSLNRVVALKLIRAGEFADEDEIARFHAEAEAAAQLDHPGIVPVYEVGEQDGQHFLSMAFVQGGSLAEQLVEGPLPPKRAAELIKLTAEAVQYAHEHGVIHRDLKPRNILRDAGGQPRISDFGLAKNLLADSDLTATGKTLGTPAYMPPEQVRAAEVGPLADVYSLGATLYCLLTGRPPFQAATSHETMLQVVEREPVALRTLNPSIPKDLETICLKCLRKEPGKRYASAACLGEDLSRWLKHKPILARPVSRLEKARLWCRRRPSVAALIATVLVISAAALLMVSNARREKLAEQVRTTVASLNTSRGIILPPLKDLEELPPAMVATELRDEFEMADDNRKLALAYALAEYGDIRIDFLVSRVEDVSPDEFDNFIAAFMSSESDVITALEEAARTAEGEENWRYKARLAMLAMKLNAPALAQDMCELRPDPIERTLFIDECKTWHGDLSSLVKFVSESGDTAFRSAVVLIVGGVSPSEVTATDKRAWQPPLSKWFASAPDTLTHSATAWTIRQWDLDLPSIPTSTQPEGGRDWHVNSVGMTMLKIPSGTFVRRDGQGGFPNEQQVTLTQSFLMADREVTRTQFLQFIDDPDYPNAEKPAARRPPQAYGSTENHPVRSSNWYDAVQFCNWLSRREGLTPTYERTGETETIAQLAVDVWSLVDGASGYRLPTEAEWEYACRAGTMTAFSFGDDETLLDDYAVYRVGQTDLTANKMPNPWGLFDMHGNVREWCHDWLAPYGAELVVTDPVRISPERTTSRILRGGSYNSIAGLTGSRPREYAIPMSPPVDVGFRVVRTYP